MPRTVNATRYVTALREGGSLPGLVEADDEGMYVVKFRGAGQGTKALVAELAGGLIAQALGLPVPELVLVNIQPPLGRAEPDPEIRDLIVASPGINAGLDFLPGALDFTPNSAIDPDFAADAVWLDALITNVDRTARNPNLLVWHGRTWLIDHGASFYLHHRDDSLLDQARRPFPLIAEHVMLPSAGSILDADARLAALLTPERITDVFAAVPDDWLGEAATASRQSYVDYLIARLTAPRVFVAEAEAARVR